MTELERVRQAIQLEREAIAHYGAERYAAALSAWLFVAQAWERLAADGSPRRRGFWLSRAEFAYRSAAGAADRVADALGRLRPGRQEGLDA